jgi:hypothetical protein
VGERIMEERNITDFSTKSKYEERFKERQENIRKQVALKCATEITVALISNGSFHQLNVETLSDYTKRLAEKFERWLIQE